jgi:predicted RNase H-like HicB family nuclease
MKFMVVVHPVKDGIWTVECPSIPGCMGRGATKDEALKNITKAIARCLKERAVEELPTSIEPSVLDPKE